jgi:hypothetical protein
MARKRIEKKPVEYLVSTKEFFEIKLGSFEYSETSDPDYIMTKKMLEAITYDRDEGRPGFREEVLKDLLRERREFHALHGRGSGSTRRAESERRAKQARTIDERTVRRKYPHLISARARAAKVLELWPQDEDETLRPSLTFIRHHLEKISGLSGLSYQGEHSDLEGRSLKPRRKTPAIPNALLEQPLAGGHQRTALRRDDWIDSLRKALAERAQNAKRTAIGRAKAAPATAATATATRRS